MTQSRVSNTTSPPSETGRLPRAIYVERGTMATEKMIPLTEKSDDDAPYFAIVLVPGWNDRPNSAGEAP